MQSNSKTEVTSEGVENPKDKWGMAKPGISSIPSVAIAMLGQAMAEGERKYGLTNWRGTKVNARLYYDAAQRHMMAWLDGETVDRASGIHHLALAMADLCIILDGTHFGKLVDDRTAFPGSFGDWLDENTAVKDPNAKQPAVAEVTSEATWPLNMVGKTYCNDCSNSRGCYIAGKCLKFAGPNL